MNKLLLFIIIGQFIWPLSTKAASPDLSQKLAGKILLQVESYGRAWYVHPVEQTRYYLKDGASAYDIMRKYSLGISDKDLAKIKTASGQSYDYKLTERLKGYILLQVESHGEAWYVHPDTGIRYYLKDGPAAYDIMRELSLGISNSDLDQIPVSDKQIVSSYSFDDVAYARYENGVFQEGYFEDKILPIASLSKLMTALVLLDLEPNWNKKLTITSAQINYPKEYVGEDKTSEVNIVAGQTVSFYDLWVAMLLASSNQSAVALAESTGLSRVEFVDKMNAKAKELGLEKTIFYDIAGLDASNVSTAKEMALIAQEAFSKSEIVEASAKGQYTIYADNTDGTESEIAVVNRNYSLMAYGLEAAKTGFLIEAQRTAVFKKGDQIFSILHARSMPERNEVVEKLLKINKAL